MNLESTVACAQETAALTQTLWTHREKGGWYEVLLVVTGAGEMNGQQVVIYCRVATHEIYARTLRSWRHRMEPRSTEPDPNLTHWQDD